MKYWVISLALVPLGCDFHRDPVDALFEDYINRIANVQDERALPLLPNQSVLLPDKRDLTLSIEPITIGLLDSYELRKCSLFNLIAERNSVLGKVQDQFREFDFQIALRKGITKCLQSEHISTELKTQLNAIYQLKQGQLPRYSANLLFTSDAMRQQLNGNEWIALDNQITSGELIRAYGTLNAMIETQDRDSSYNLALHQEVFEKVNLMGQLWFSLHNASKKLARVTEQLQKFDDKIICQSGRDTTKFRYLNNVFNHIYIERVQPYMARLDAHYFKLSPYITILENTHPEYRYPIRAAHQMFRDESMAHVKYWQELFERCGKNVTR